VTELEKDVRRVADRLRTAPVARVDGVRVQVRELLQDLADATAGIEAREDAAPPRWREVPALPDSALGDQLDVLGGDLVTAVSAAGGPTTVADLWSRSGRTAVRPVLDALAARLATLRSAL
jgi:hypothetical protein